MRRSLAVTAVLLFGWTVQAQQPLSVNPSPAPPAAPAPAGGYYLLTPASGAPVAAAPAGPPVLPDGQPRFDGDREALFVLDVLVGQELGVRAQAAVYRSNCAAVVAEAFYGALLHGLGSSEAFGGGGRYLIRRCSADSMNSVMLGPGLSVFYQTDNNRLILVNPSVELSWLHGFGDRCGWEIGLNAGVGVGVSGTTNKGDSGVGKTTSLISLYTGFRF